MFKLTDIEDTIRIEAANLEIDRAKALADEINKKYANRVLQGVGLCIFLHDILKASEGKVRWGDGCVYHLCTFRLVVFRPFPGEIIEGKLKSQNEEGIRVSLDFFDDIYVLPQLMPDICAFDHHERAWFWIYQPPPDESDPVATQQSRITDPYTTNRDDRLYMYVGDQIRFSVEEDEFNDPEPGPSAATSTLPGGVMEGAKIGGGAFAPAPAPGVGPAGAQGGNVASAGGAAPGEAGTGPTIQASADGTTAPAGAAFMERLAPYILVGSIAAQGLGIVGWWGDDQGAQEEAAMEDVNGYQEGAEA